MANKALFLDRDGIINRDYGYVFKPNDFEFMPNIVELICRANCLDYLVIVVTNQSGIARGLYSIAQFEALTNWMISTLKDKGAIINDVLFCPHHPNQGHSEFTKTCDCRKPASGMFVEAQIKHDIDLSNSVMIGDKQSDMLASSAVGIQQNYWFGGNTLILSKQRDDFNGQSVKVIEHLGDVTL